MKNILRKLETLEIDTINRALEEFAANHPHDKNYGWAAKSMLEQNMPENFFWNYD